MFKNSSVAGLPFISVNSSLVNLTYCNSQYRYTWCLKMFYCLVGLYEWNLCMNWRVNSCFIHVLWAYTDAVFGENLDALQQAIAQHVSQNPGIQGQVCSFLFVYLCVNSLCVRFLLLLYLWKKFCKLLQGSRPSEFLLLCFIDVLTYLMIRFWWYSQLWWLLRSLMDELFSRHSTRLSDSQTTMTFRTRFFRLFAILRLCILHRACCLFQADTASNWFA